MIPAGMHSINPELRGWSEEGAGPCKHLAASRDADKRNKVLDDKKKKNEKKKHSTTLFFG